MKTIYCFIAAVVFCTSVFCQTTDSTSKDSITSKVKTPGKIKVYHVNYFVEGAIIAVGMAGDLFAIPRLKSKAPLSEEELTFVNTDQQKNLINTVDQWSLKQPTSDRALWKKVSDYGEIGIFILPSLLMIDKNIRKDWLHLLFMYVEGHTVTFTFYNYSPLGPYFQNRLRPAVYYPALGVEAQRNPNNRNSFYSGHVASCSYSTFFMVKVYCDYHPNIGAKKYLLYLAASVPPLVIAYARIRSLDHFPSDVAVGFGLGAVIGIVVPALHKIKAGRNLSLSLYDSQEVTGLSIAWKLGNQRAR
ncbi:MAG: phosphatase PAP2 family protein [Bacteroidota bacterium]